MFPAGCWKLGQVSNASAAIDAVCRFRAEPKRTAPLTYLKIQAQIIHFIPFRRRSPPTGLRCFSTVEGARSGCYEASCSIGRALTACSIGPKRLSVRRYVRCSTLGKIKNLIFLFSIRRFKRRTPFFSLLPRPSGLPHLQNGKFHGYSFRQITCQD